MIGDWNLEDLVQPLEGQLRGANVAFEGVTSDSRQLMPGQLFVALQGPRFDGHRFVQAAEKAGAAAALVSHFQPQALPQIRVADCLEGLGRLGHLNRRAFAGPLVAVTGSNGKTSVKEMLAEILRGEGEVLATRGNLNNVIGVPLTLLELSERHRFAVVELGASGPGEIAHTTALAAPDVAVLNNASAAHLEGFGSLAGVVRAKGEIFQGLGPAGIAVVNRDDPHADTWLAGLRRGKALTFSMGSPDADLFASHLQPDAWGRYQFALHTHQGETGVHLAVVGRQAVANALAAAAAAYALDVPLTAIGLGLERFQGVAGRLSLVSGPPGWRLIDDSYNANPASLKAAIEVLASLPGPRLLMLGDMAELGEDAVRQHREAGRLARDRGIETLVAVGSLAAEAAGEFGQAGVVLSGCDEALEWLAAWTAKNPAVLVKGSRSAGMERVIKGLMPEEAPCS